MQDDDSCAGHIVVAGVALRGFKHWMPTWLWKIVV